jgi:hypothetical protein
MESITIKGLPQYNNNFKKTELKRLLKAGCVINHTKDMILCPIIEESQ